MKNRSLRLREGGRFRLEASDLLFRCEARPLYLAPVSLGVFVDFRQGQVGVELVSVFLRDGGKKQARKMFTDKTDEATRTGFFDFADSLATPRPSERSSPAR